MSDWGYTGMGTRSCGQWVQETTRAHHARFQETFTSPVLPTADKGGATARPCPGSCPAAVREVPPLRAAAPGAELSCRTVRAAAIKVT